MEVINFELIKFYSLKKIIIINYYIIQLSKLDIAMGVINFLEQTSEYFFSDFSKMLYVTAGAGN